MDDSIFKRRVSRRSVVRSLVGLTGAGAGAALLAACSSPVRSPAATAAPPTVAPAAAATSPAAAAPAANAAKWDFVIYLPLTGHPVTEFLLQIPDAVRARTNGQLDITVRAPGELPYNPTEFVRSAGGGNVQMADCYAGLVAGDLKFGSLPYLPFLMRTPEEVVQAMKVVEPHVRRELNGFGAELIYWYLYPTQKIWGRGTPVTNIAGLKGRKVRTTGPDQAAFIEKAGGVPVTLATAEVPTAAQRGVVEGVLTAAITILGSRWYEFTNWGYALDVSIGGPSYVVANRAALEQLPTEVRRGLLEVGAEFHQTLMREIPGREEGAMTNLQANHSITINRASDADFQEGRQLMQEYWTTWAQQAGGEVPAVLSEVRKTLNV